MFAQLERQLYKPDEPGWYLLCGVSAHGHLPLLCWGFYGVGDTIGHISGCSSVGALLGPRETLAELKTELVALGTGIKFLQMACMVTGFEVYDVDFVKNYRTLDEWCAAQIDRSVLVGRLAKALRTGDQTEIWLAQSHPLCFQLTRSAAERVMYEASTTGPHPVPVAPCSD